MRGISKIFVCVYIHIYVYIFYTLIYVSLNSFVV